MEWQRAEITKEETAIGNNVFAWKMQPIFLKPCAWHHHGVRDVGTSVRTLSLIVLTVHLWLIISDLALQQWRFPIHRERERERERERLKKMETQPEEEIHGRRYRNPGIRRWIQVALGPRIFLFSKPASYPFPPPAEYNLSQKVSCCSELAIVWHLK